MPTDTPKTATTAVKLAPAHLNALRNFDTLPDSAEISDGVVAVLLSITRQTVWKWAGTACPTPSSAAVLLAGRSVRFAACWHPRVEAMAAPTQSATLAGAPPHAQQLTEAQRKAYATAQAHAMWFYGIRLDLVDGDDGAPTYIATLHALTRNFRTLAEVEGWLHALDEHEAPRGELARFLGTQEVDV